MEANEDIWLMNPDGTDARKVVTSVGSEIAVVDLSTGDVTSLTDNDVYDMMPSWRSSS